MSAQRSEAMKRAFACAALPLEPPEGHYRRAAEMHQYPIGHMFGEWRVVGESFLKWGWLANGELKSYPHTPVECTCRDVDRVRKEIRTVALVHGRSLGCGHVARDHVKTLLARQFKYSSKAVSS